jgi:hypothetical protein
LLSRPLTLVALADCAGGQAGGRADLDWRAKFAPS